MSTQVLRVAGALIPLLGLLGFLYKRFRQSGAEEMESFSRYMAQGLKYYVGRLVRRKLAGELTLRQYARVHLRGTATEMMVPATYPVRLRTDDVFVPLLLRDASKGTVEYQDLLDRRRGRVLILGEPGSGKSSLMKRTFRDACRRAIADPGHAPMPILYELRNLSRMSRDELQVLTRKSLFKQCIRSLDDAAAFKTRSSVEDLRHGGGFLVLLDGLDEVPREASLRVTQAISELAEHLALTAPSSSLIVSTRTQHYLALQNRPFKELFQPLLIRPFSIADVYRFLLNWPFESGRAATIARLFARIRQLPSLTEMCTNPLALAMFVARDQQTEGADSPETRTEFYSSLVNELLVSRRFRQEETRVGRQRLRRTRERILGQICLGHLLNANEALNSIPAERMLQGVKEFDVNADDPAIALETLAIDTGLFSAEREGESYRFMHLTLCEFLAARAVINGGLAVWTEVADRLAERDESTADWNSRLGEVIAFASGLAPDALGEAILRNLTGLSDDSLLLRAAIEAQNYTSAKVLGAVNREEVWLSSKRPDEWDVAWFSRLRWLLAVLRDMDSDRAHGIPDGLAQEIPTPASYLIGLIDRHGAADLILATLARADTEAALTIAEDSKRAELMDVVAGAADDFGTLLAILARYEAGSKLWGQALVHCAFRERRIAAVLHACHESIGPPSVKRRWETSFVTDGSVYGRLLDQVLEARSEWRPEDTPLLSKLVHIHPPQRAIWAALKSANLMRVLPGLIAGLALVGLVVLVAQHPDAWSGPPLRAALIVGLSALLASLAGSLRQRTRRLLRRSLMSREGSRVYAEVGGATFRLAAAEGRVLGATAGRDVVMARMSQVRILEETLNLARYRFTGWAGRRSPKGMNLLLAGVSREEARALKVARRLRS